MGLLPCTGYGGHIDASPAPLRAYGLDQGSNQGRLPEGRGMGLSSSQLQPNWSEESTPGREHSKKLCVAPGG